MPYAYFNNGLSYRAVDSSYVAQSGEAVFSGTPTSDQLTSAFAGYAAAVGALQNTALRAQANLALDKSDIVASRCYKAGVAFPSAWLTYVESLRNIVNGTDTTSTSLPVTPTYPAGT
jgi:hypothetical protein